MSVPGGESKHGGPIYHHRTPKGRPTLAETDTQAAEALEHHIEQYVGARAGTFHELVSEYVHVDVHIVPPSGQRNFYTLITMGMSDLPMNVPPGAEHLRYGEVMLCLPADWKMYQHDWEDDETYYWPVRWLKTLARLPHQYKTWLTRAHSVPNDDPPQPFASNTQLCGVTLAAPVLFPHSFAEVFVRSDKTIQLYSVIPIYKQELDFKMKYGAKALFDRLSEANVSELLDIKRKNTLA